MAKASGNTRSTRGSNSKSYRVVYFIDGTSRVETLGKNMSLKEARAELVKQFSETEFGVRNWKDAVKYSADIPEIEIDKDSFKDDGIRTAIITEEEYKAKGYRGIRN